MKIRSLPAKLLVEVLHYLADYERLDGLTAVLDPEIPMEDVRTALREIALHLASQIQAEKEKGHFSVSLSHFSPATRHLLETLSPTEEKRLFEACGLLENS
jgi:hypothetical protein